MNQRRLREHVEPSRERFRRAPPGRLRRRGRREGGAALAARTTALADVIVLPPAHLALLDELRARHRVAVVSNSTTPTPCSRSAPPRRRPGRHGRGVESLGYRKPHPLMVESALRSLDVAQDAALMVGDTFAEDVEAAHAAGVDAAWLDRQERGVPPGATPPRFVVASLADLPSVLA
jgi:FMN phosphatase YigB (HAD superfamily)